MPGPLLVITAGAGDEVAACGGSIANHVAAGNQMRIVHLTSRPGSGRAAESSALDAQERHAVAAAAALGVGIEDVQFLRFPRLGIDPASLAQLGALASIVRSLRPQLVYLPHPQERTHEYRAAFALCWRAVLAAATRECPEWGADPHWTPRRAGLRGADADRRAVLHRGHHRGAGPKACRARLLSVR